MTLDDVTAVVPAAGRSSRFGAMKLLADVDGRRLIERTIAALLDAGVARVVVVSRDPAAFSDVALLADPRVDTIANPAPERGMFSSIQVGLAAATGRVVLVLPADMPFVSAATVAAVAGRATATGSTVVPVHAGRRGHPIAIPRALCDELLALVPTTTLKDGLAALARTTEVLDVDDPGVLRDVDVPGDLTG
jgi:molybdenum cofactor cytidylyltransferase